MGLLGGANFSAGSTGNPNTIKNEIVSLAKETQKVAQGGTNQVKNEETIARMQARMAELEDELVVIDEEALADAEVQKLVDDSATHF